MLDTRTARLLATLALLPEALVLALHPLGLIPDSVPYVVFYGVLTIHGLFLFGPRD